MPSLHAHFDLPVDHTLEFARAYLQKKMLKKPLREDAGADVLRDSPCSAHVSG